MGLLRDDLLNYNHKGGAVMDKLIEILFFFSRFLITGVGLYLIVLFFKLLKEEQNLGTTISFHNEKQDLVMRSKREDILIGRSSNSDLCIKDITVSRYFAKVQRVADDTYYLEKEGSGYLEVNGNERIKSSSLKNNDTIKIGDEGYTIGISTSTITDNTVVMKILSGITVFQLLIVSQILLLGAASISVIIKAYLPIIIIPWLYAFTVDKLKLKMTISIELVVFFLTTLGITVAGSDTMVKVSIIFCLGFVAFLGLSLVLIQVRKFPKDKLNKMKIVLLVVLILLFFINLIFADVTNGAKNWINIGGFSLQLSELCKLALVFISGSFLISGKKDLALLGIATIISLFALVAINDLGTAAVFFVISFVGLYLKNGDLLLSAGITSVSLLLGKVLLKISSTFQQRFITWQNPFDSYFDGGFHICKSLSGFVGGGLFGAGLYCGSIRDIYASTTDIVFSLLAEEFGVVFFVITMLLYVVLLLLAYTNSCRKSYYFLSCGILVLSSIAMQLLLNAGGSLNLIPLTGITAPWLSTGGSSLLVSYAMLALISDDIKLPKGLLKRKGKQYENK